jgi:hypothetical protein
VIWNGGLGGGGLLPILSNYVSLEVVGQFKNHLNLSKNIEKPCLARKMHTQAVKLFIPFN